MSDVEQLRPWLRVVGTRYGAGGEAVAHAIEFDDGSTAERAKMAQLLNYLAQGRQLFEACKQTHGEEEAKDVMALLCYEALGKKEIIKMAVDILGQNATLQFVEALYWAFLSEKSDAAK